MGKTNDTSHYEGALLEDINDRLQAIQEGQAALAHMPNTLAQLQTDMTEVKADIKVIKMVVTDHSRDINNHEVRLTKLEAARV